MAQFIQIRCLGKQDYEPVWHAMRQFTEHRTEQTIDELWLVEHNPVFTLGQAGKETHILAPGEIPIIRTDRGGQVTYHGPGQLVIYFLLDMRRLQLGVRDLVWVLEQTIVDLLATYAVNAHIQCGAPGVYIEKAKIASIGLRIKKGCSYHGMALNVDMDLSPFTRINPCGYQNLTMTQLSEHAKGVSLQQVREQLTAYMLKKLSYTNAVYN